MKLTIFIIVLAASVCCANAQGVYARIGGESTVAGLRYGGSIGYVAKSKFQTGIFYQQSVSASEFSGAIPANFTGLEISVPLVKCEKLYVSGHLRGGIANKMFIVVIPGFRTSVVITPRFEAGAGMHWRYNRPAHELSLQFKI